MKHRTMITAHTGFGTAPDNTWSSFIEAIEMKVDIAEVDVRVTGKGEPVLLHDHSPLLTQYSYAELNRKEIRTELSPIYHEHELVSLAEVLDEAKRSGIKLNLDLKSGDSVNPALELVQKHAAEHLVFVTGCTDGIQVDTDGMTVLMNVEPAELELEPAAVCQLAKSRGYQGLNMEHSLLSPVWVESAREHHLLISVYTVNEAKQLERCLELGVDSITTMQVAQLQEMMKLAATFRRE